MKKNFPDIISILNSSEKKKFALLVLLNFIISIADIFSLAWMLFIINLYAQQAGASKFLFLPKWLMDKDSLLPVLFFLLFFSIKNLAGYLVLQSQYGFVYKVAARLSENNLMRYLEDDYNDYINIDSAVQIKKINQHPIEYAHYVLFGVQQIFTEAMLIFFSITAILFFNVKLFLLLFIILIPAISILSVFIKRRLKQARADIKSSGERSLQYLQEALNGYVESNVYQKNKFFTKRYTVYQQLVNKYLSRMQSTQGVSSRLIEVFAVLGLFILIAASKVSGYEQGEQLITIGAFMAAAYKIIPGIVRIINCVGQIKTYSFTIDDLKSSNIAQNVAESVSETKINSISFRNVYFNHNEIPLVENFNLEIENGDFVGISGNSGKGKTTVLNLLLGFLSPQKGDILFNDIKTDANERKKSWEQITYIKQQGFFIDGTILENIILSDKDFDEEKINKVIQQSGLKELVAESTEGLQKLITESGKNISGGQRQRIAVARALYKDASLFILDEPFSELDAASENLLVKQFKELAETGKTVLLITHNKSSLSFCNKIISLDE